MTLLDLNAVNFNKILNKNEQIYKDLDEEELRQKALISIPRDFVPWNQWKIEDLKKPGVITWHDYGVEAKFIVDQTTEKKYLNQPKTNIRAKCCALFIGTFPLQPIFFTIHTILNLIDCASKLMHGRCREGAIGIAKMITRIVLLPLTLLALQSAALYGIANPYDGRKLYASIERVGLVGERDIIPPFFLAPCFQPDATSHLFGGNLDDCEAW